MKSTLLILSVLAIATCLNYDSLNRLSKTELTNMLNEDHTVLAMLYSPSCSKCGNDFWSAYKSMYSFGYTKKFVVAAASFGESKDIEEEYSISETTERVVFLLFISGSDTPLTRDEDDTDLIKWIEKNTKVKAKQDVTFHMNDLNYNQFTKKSKDKNVVLFFYVSTDSNSQQMEYEFYETAYAFKSIRQLLFASVDCSESRSMCSYYKVQRVPTVTLLPNKETAFDNKELNLENHEKIDSYVNRYLGTFVSGHGGLNEKYGRDDVLDQYAHEFMNTDDVEEKKHIMKMIVKLKNKHRNSFRYYKLMKEMMTNPSYTIEQEKKEVNDALSHIDDNDKEYPKLKARMNVADQFEKISFTKSVLSLTPSSFDYVCNGKRNVIVKFYAPWCGHCRALAPIYEELAKNGVDDVVFAEFDADKYSEFASRYGIQGFPTMKWFAKGGDPDAPVMVDSERTKEGITAFIHAQLNGEIPAEGKEEAAEEL